jgi:hypothetical protein
MAHHSTKNTVSRAKWCNKCGRQTQHAVSDGRVGHCLEHTPDGPVAVEMVPLAPVEIDLPCECDKYPFAHYHAEQSSFARQRRFEDARKGRA